MSPPKASSSLSINCPNSCQFHPDTIGQETADKLRAFAETKPTQRAFQMQAAKLLGRAVSGTGVWRHFKHYRHTHDPARGEEAQEIATDAVKKVPDLVILDSIIASGFRNSKNWKPTIKDTLDAMKLKAQMTGNSAFEDLLAAMNASLDLADGEVEDEEMPESPDAVASEDEQGQGEA